MDPILVVSPHLDDAVLSAGTFLDSWPGATVLTVFAGRPSTAVTTPFDAHCGFADSGAAMAARVDEDDRALAVMKSRPVRGVWLDEQYDRDRDSDAERVSIQQGIAELARQIGATKLIGPLGIMHSDHVLVAKAVAWAAKETEMETWCYEDLPNRVLFPEAVPEALERWRSSGFAPALDFIGAGDASHKEEAFGCYASQLWALDRHACLVPERFWQQWPA